MLDDYCKMLHKKFQQKSAKTLDSQRLGHHHNG